MSEPRRGRSAFLPELGENPWVRAALLLILLSVLGTLLYRIAGILKLLVYATVLAYLFDPVVDRLERLRLPRTAAVMTLIFLMVASLFTASIFLVPALSKNFDEFLQKLPSYTTTLTRWLVPRIEGLLHISIPVTLNDWLEQAGRYQGAIEKIWKSVNKPLVDTMAQTLTGLQGLINGLLSLVVIPVAWFYLLRDFDGIKQAVLNLFPSRHRDRVLACARRIDGVMAGFMRGQLTVCLVLGLIYALGLHFVAKVPLGVFIGLFAGVASVVPYLGLMIGIGPAVVLALLEHGDLLHPGLVVAVFTVGQLLEGLVITPKVIGDELGLHPVTIIFAIMIWGHLLGLVGMIIAVPATAVLWVFAEEGIKVYKASDFYRFGGLDKGE